MYADLYILEVQIENEYGPVEWEIGAPGKAYTKWAAQMAVGLNTGVPWIMCKQEDAPDPIVTTFNFFPFSLSSICSLVLINLDVCILVAPIVK